jgi:hypothetical protein
MKLQVGPSIDSNMVRLDFRKSPDKPENSPSYKIEKNKADEFVKKYNNQESKLVRYTNLAVALWAVIGWGISIYKRSLKMALLWVPAGILAGLGIGAAISNNKKNDLMNKYNVREYSVRNYF